MAKICSEGFEACRIVHLIGGQRDGERVIIAIKEKRFRVAVPPNLSFRVVNERPSERSDIKVQVYEDIGWDLFMMKGIENG